MLATATVLGLSACGVHEPPQAQGTRLTIVESYGDQDRREVAISVTLVDEAEGVLGLADASVRLTPDTDSAVKKLEAVLDDAALRVGRTPWPEPARVVPFQAVPALERIQLALALLDGPEGTADHPIIRIFERPATLGLTRLVRRGDQLTVTSLALAGSSAGGSLTARGALQGHLTATGATLTGERVLDGTSQTVTLSIDRRPTTDRQR